MVIERNMDISRMLVKQQREGNWHSASGKQQKQMWKNRPRTSDEEVIIRMNKECNSLLHYAYMEEQSSFDFLISAYQWYIFEFTLYKY